MVLSNNVFHFILKNLVHNSVGVHLLRVFLIEKIKILLFQISYLMDNIVQPVLLILMTIMVTLLAQVLLKLLNGKMVMK